MKKVVSSLVAFLALTIISGCTSGGETAGGTSNLSVNETGYAATTGADGVAVLQVTVPEGANAFQLVISSASGFAQVLDVVDPTGASIFPLKAASYSGGLGLQLSPVTVSVPVLGGPAKSGVYTLTVGAAGAKGGGVGGTAISVNVVSKSDGDLSSGTLRANMILLGPVGGDSDVRSDLEDVVEVWKQIFSNANIKLDLAWYDFSGDAIAPAPGSLVYQSITEGVRKNSLNVVIAAKAAGTGGMNFQYGIPGAIGGAAIPTSRSVNTFSILAATGSDGQFNHIDTTRGNFTQRSDDEVRVAGEELAQMAGHYLGLQHIVELSGSTVTQSDFIGDTGSCISLTSCRDSKEVRGNFMFPYPLQRGREADSRNLINQKYARTDVTPAQAAVMNAHVLVD